jgi:hypothetical protein
MTKPDKNSLDSSHGVVVRRVTESSPGSTIRVERIELTREIKTAISTSFELGRNAAAKKTVK